MGVDALVASEAAEARRDSTAPTLLARLRFSAVFGAMSAKTDPASNAAPEVLAGRVDMMLLTIESTMPVTSSSSSSSAGSAGDLLLREPVEDRRDFGVCDVSGVPTSDAARPMLLERRRDFCAVFGATSEKTAAASNAAPEVLVGRVDMMLLTTESMMPVTSSSSSSSSSSAGLAGDLARSEPVDERRLPLSRPGALTAVGTDDRRPLTTLL